MESLLNIKVRTYFWLNQPFRTIICLRLMLTFLSALLVFDNVSLSIITLEKYYCLTNELRLISLRRILKKYKSTDFSVSRTLWSNHIGSLMNIYHYISELLLRTPFIEIKISFCFNKLPIFCSKGYYSFKIHKSKKYVIDSRENYITIS